MIPVLALIAQIALTPLPTPAATPTFVASPVPTPTAEIAPLISCVMAGDTANCTSSNLNHARQLSADGNMLGFLSTNGPFKISFPAGSGAHKIDVEGFTSISVTAP